MTGLINQENKSKIDKNLVKAFFKIENKNIVEFINLEKKYYVVQMTKVSQTQKDKNNKAVRDSIKAQINIENKIN